MDTINSASVTLTFQDMEKKSINLPNLPSYAMNTATIKAHANTLNELMAGASAADDTLEYYQHDFPRTFVSSTGAPAARISAVTLTSKIEEVVYSG